MIRQESVRGGPITATTADFGLKGGRYMVAVVATWGGGSVGLETLGPDGSTYLTVMDALSADGGTTLDLPPGLYRVTVATATGVYYSITQIPIGA